MKYKKELIVIVLAVTGLAIYYFWFAGNSDLESLVYEQKTGVIKKIIVKSGSILEADKYTESFEILKITSKPGKVKDVYVVEMIYAEGVGYWALTEEWSFREKKAKFIRVVSDRTTTYDP